MGTAAPKLGESLAELRPDVAADWHPTRNKLTPEQVKRSSQKRVWWCCQQCGHEWEAVVGNRTGHAGGCPSCKPGRLAANRTRPSPGESLAEVLPDLAAEWHPTLNNGLTPAGVRPNSSKQVWWLCPVDGREWKTQVTRRAAGSGCRTCAAKGRASRRTQATARHGRPLTEYLLSEWHPARNDRSPETITSGSDYPAWWTCSTCGHQWQATVSNRAKGSGCPKCATRRRTEDRRRPAIGKSLAALRPDLVEEWHPTRNPPVAPADVRLNSSLPVWWRCRNCAHEWKTEIFSRRDGQGCRLCAAKARGVKASTPSPGKSLADVHPQIAAEWDLERNRSDVTPATIKPFANVKAWWVCRNGHHWRTLVTDRTKNGSGCPRCILHGTSVQEIRLSFELAALGVPIHVGYPPIPVVARRPVRADIVVPTWRIVIEFDGFRWHRRLQKRDRDQTEALLAGGWKVIRLREGNLPPLDVGEMSIDVPLNATVIDLTAAACHALGKSGHVVRKLGTYLANATPLARDDADKYIYSVREISLETEFSDVAAEWHPHRNAMTPSQVAPRANLQVWWLCPICGREWQAWINNRTGGMTGCPDCGRRKSDASRARAKPGKSIAERNPDMATAWHPTLNGDETPATISAGSHTPRWWQCSQCGAAWAASPHNMMKRPVPSQCATCYRAKKPGNPARRRIHTT